MGCLCGRGPQASQRKADHAGRLHQGTLRTGAIANQKAGQATVDALAACFGDLYERELRSVVAFDIERFKTKRRKASIKPATVNRDLDRIRKVFSCALEWEFLSEQLRPQRTDKPAATE
jgi:hypothetical protein